MKIHLHNTIPEEKLSERQLKTLKQYGYRGTKCGIMNQNITKDVKEVTCQACLNALYRIKKPNRLIARYKKAIEERKAGIKKPEIIKPEVKWN